MQWLGLNPDMPGLDCIPRGHVLTVEMTVPGAFATYPGTGEAWARWCLWCGGGVSNELLPTDDTESPQ